jgi:hypothetical protein
MMLSVAGVLLLVSSPANLTFLDSLAMKTYVQCIADLAPKGRYNWTDGGVSAKRLTDACRYPGRNVMNLCMSQLKDEKSCGLTLLLYSQMALQALHKTDE